MTLITWFMAMGIWVIAHGAALTGIYEIYAGELTSPGYSGKHGWWNGMLLMFFGRNAPKASGVFHLILSAVFVWMGVGLLRERGDDAPKPGDQE